MDETNELFMMYGVSQSAYGHITELSLRDVIERDMKLQGVRKIADEYIEDTKRKEKEIQRLDDDLVVSMKKTPQTIGTGKKIFKVKAKRFNSKFI